MKTVSVEKLFKDEEKESSPYTDDLFWLGVWVILSLFSRVWGDLFERLVSLWLGTRKRTLFQLIAFALGALVVVMLFVRFYDIGLERKKENKVPTAF